MKKLLVIMISIAFLLTGCLGRPAPDKITEQWQTLTITGIGSFRVPAEWYVEEDDYGILFLTNKPRSDRDYTIHMVGARSGISFPLYELFDGVKSGELLRSWSSSWLFDLDGIVSLQEYTVNGVRQEHYSILLSNSQRYSYTLFGWNREIVNEWLADQIARTVAMFRADYEHPNIGRLESPISEKSQ